MKTSDDFKYTNRQWNFCEQILLHDTKLAAYKAAYDCSRMKDSTVAVKISKLLAQEKTKVRLNELRGKIAERNAMTIEKLIEELSNMVRFDPGELYDEHGSMKSIHDMPKVVRQMMASIDVSEINEFIGGEKIKVGTLTKIKLMDKLNAIEKLMKYFDAYNKHNKSAAGEVVIYQIPDNGRK